MRVSEGRLAAARARVRLAGGPGAPRLAARRAGAVPQADLRAADPGLLALARDEARLARALALAAAALCGPRLAAAITPAERAVQGALLDPERRRFALAHRPAATPPDLAAPPLGEALALAEARARAALAGRLPRSVAEALGLGDRAAPSQAVTRCLDAALAAVGATGPSEAPGRAA